MTINSTDRRLVAVSAYGPSGASSRVRIHDWLRHLGVEAQIYSYLNGSDASARRVLSEPGRAARAEVRLRQLARRVSESTLLLSRAASPLSTGEIEANLLARAGHGVYDFDDALYADRRVGIHRIFAKPRVWRRAVTAADTVIAGNDRLAEEARRINDRVVVIPSCVEPGDYVRKSSYELAIAPRIVWMGSPATEKYLSAAASTVLRLNREMGASLTVISAGASPLPEGLDAVAQRVQWSPERSGLELSRADVAIGPLTDDEFSRGKCAYKLLQYGAAGIPFVASPVGVNKTVISDLHGLAASREEEWYGRLREILDAPPATRAALGASGRASVEAKYSYRAWASDFRGAMGW